MRAVFVLSSVCAVPVCPNGILARAAFCQFDAVSKTSGSELSATDRSAPEVHLGRNMSVSIDRLIR